MQSLPGLFNTPIQMQGQALTNQVGGYNNLMNQYQPYGTQQQTMPWQMFGQGIGNIFAGANAGANAYNQANNQQDFQKTLMDYLRGGGTRE